MPALTSLFEIAVCRGDEADVGALCFVGADAFEGAFARKPEELHLNGGIDFADFVEEERAALSGFDAADAAFVRAGECAFFMAEEFAFEERWREAGAMDRDHRLRRTWTELVNGFGYEFFAGAAFAE